VSDRQASNTGETFNQGSLDGNAWDFEDFMGHYANMDPEGLLDEARFLFGEDTSEFPVDLTPRRLNAFLICLINCAANCNDVTDRRRSRLVTLAIYLDAYLTRKADADVTVATTLSTTLDGVRLFGLFPVVAELIQNQITDYVGAYEETTVIYE
jgi:hypothetical protein